VQNYGYYMQGSGWTDNRKHTSFAASEKALSTRDQAKNGVKNLGVEKTLDDTGIADVRFALTMNAKTIVNVFFKPEPGYTVDGSYVETMPIGNETYYRVDSSEFGPANLGTRQEVTAGTEEGDEPATVNVCPMSYVKAMLDRTDLAEGKANALIAFYDYYVAAVDFAS
jgi:hypothetical protein